MRENDGNSIIDWDGVKIMAGAGMSSRLCSDSIVKEWRTARGKKTIVPAGPLDCAIADRNDELGFEYVKDLIFPMMDMWRRHIVFPGALFDQRELTAFFERGRFWPIWPIQTVSTATIPTRTDSGRNRTTEASSKVPYKQRTTSST